MIKAQSFDNAYKIAEKKARENEMEYTNTYGQLVNCKFIEAIDCFSISDETLGTGVEIYSRFLRVYKDIDTQDFIDKYYPDTIEDNSGIDYQFVLLIEILISKLGLTPFEKGSDHWRTREKESL